VDRGIEPLVMAYLDGALDAEGARRLADHFKTHAADYDEFIALARLDRQLCVFAPVSTAASVGPGLSGSEAMNSPDRFVRRVMAQLRARSAGRRPPARRRIARWMWVAAALLLAVAAAAAWHVAQRGAGRSDRPAPQVDPQQEAFARHVERAKTALREKRWDDALEAIKAARALRDAPELARYEKEALEGKKPAPEMQPPPPPPVTDWVCTKCKGKNVATATVCGCGAKRPH
jgi:hypothetical protein